MTSLSGGRADAADSKSVGLKTVRVQVPPPARKEIPESACSQGFYIEEAHRILAVCGGLIGSACRRNAPESTLLVFYYIQYTRFVKIYILGFSVENTA